MFSPQITSSCNEVELIHDNTSHFQKYRNSEVYVKSLPEHNLCTTLRSTLSRNRREGEGRVFLATSRSLPSLKAVQSLSEKFIDTSA